MFRISHNDLEEKAYHIRKLLINLIYQAKSGHLDTSLSLVEVYLSIVYSDFFKYNPKDGAMPERDAIFLSEGHACPIQYVINADLGYYTIEDVMKGNRKPFSPFQGHTQRNLEYGFENSNGHLGIGLWQAYGYALESKGKVFCIVGDGEFQEPTSFGILQLPLTLKPASNFCLLLNNNGIAQDSYTNIGPIAETARLYGWNVAEVDGHDFLNIDDALQDAVKSNKPSFIVCKTVKGKDGDPHHEGKLGMHGKPPKNQEELNAYIVGLDKARGL